MTVHPMASEPFNVLISSAGRRVALLNAFRSSLDRLGLAGEVQAADLSPLSSAMRVADKRHLVPRCTDSEFIPAVVEICEREKIRLVVPTIDTELPAYAARREDFERIGTAVAISDPDTIRISADKHNTHAWLTSERFPTVRQAVPAEVLTNPGSWRFPLIAKPAAGSASIGLARVSTPDELRVVAGDGDYVVQEIAPGHEHTLDVLVMRDSRAVCAVPRKRLEVRGGEVSKGMTVRHAGLQELGVTICERLPGAYGVITVQIFLDEESGALSVIEINPRFGGGFPLAYKAGADCPGWIIEEICGLPPTVRADEWRDGLVMLRYDGAVFVGAGEVGL